MKLKTAAQRSAVIIVILVLSMLFGYIYQTVGHRLDLKQHPREFSEYVERYCTEYGVPEYIVYAVILTGSGFRSNHVSEDGKIGLMQISPDTFAWLMSLTGEEMETGILYDPETNIRCGTYMLSYLFTEYSRWRTVFAVYHSDEYRVEAMLNLFSEMDEDGNLGEIPDPEPDVLAFVDEVEKESDLYQKLYYMET